MKKEDLLKLCKKEEEMTFKGWDFSYLENRWEAEDLPWNYKDIVLKYLKPTDKLLDMGTGGGEFLLTLKHPYDNTSVTESYPPNIEVCKENLQPLGITVKGIDDDNSLPFDDNSFDIIINRHEAYSLKEVKRILKPNGLFITQQVGGKNNEFLSHTLIKNFNPLYSDNTLSLKREELLENNFNIIYSKEYFPYLRFYDIGAVVYFAKILPWEFPNFSVSNSLDELINLNNIIEGNGYLDSLEHRFIFVSLNKK